MCIRLGDELNALPSSTTIISPSREVKIPVFHAVLGPPLPAKPGVGWLNSLS